MGLVRQGALSVENFVEQGSVISAGGPFFENDEYIGSVIRNNLNDDLLGQVGECFPEISWPSFKSFLMQAVNANTDSKTALAQHSGCI